MEEQVRKICEMLDELNGEVRKMFPGYSFADITLSASGFHSFGVLEFAKDDTPAERQKRRELLRVYRSDEKGWGKDESAVMNGYYAETGTLLEV